MDDLIEALQIFRKYTDTKYPTWCSHDELHICVNAEDVSEKDKKRLDELGFLIDDMTGEEEFMSFRYGSC